MVTHCWSWRASYRTDPEKKKKHTKKKHRTDPGSAHHIRFTRRCSLEGSGAVSTATIHIHRQSYAKNARSSFDGLHRP